MEFIREESRERMLALEEKVESRRSSRNPSPPREEREMSV
jgi:hypothetical protein